MLRTLLTTTALTALFSAGAIAQDAVTRAPADVVAPAIDATVLTKGYTAADSDNLATHIIGAEVYSSAAADAEHIGEVNDIVLNQDGSIAAVIVGVGGFLGVGEKNVAVDYDELQWTVASDNTERFVLPSTKEALNAAPTFKWMDDKPADAAMAPAAKDATATGAVVANNTMASTSDQAGPVVDPSQLTDVTLTADEIEGTTAYGPNNENLGKIGDIVLAQDGKTVDAVIIDFGGFLGIGTKPVAVGFDTLKFQQDQNGKHFVRLNVTRDQLDQAVAFDAGAYKSDPNKQRLVVQG